MQELAALQAAITQLSTDIGTLSTAGLVPASALTALTKIITDLDTQVKALLPTP